MSDNLECRKASHIGGEIDEFENINGQVNLIEYIKDDSKNVVNLFEKINIKESYGV